MRRRVINARPDWQKTVESQGFVFHSLGEKYWDESACYEFREWEILNLEKATTTLFEMCLQAVQHVIDRQLYDLFHIPPEFGELIASSWNNDLPSLYGRFDLGYDGHQIKLLEFNADTPTSLLEASVIQWYWLQDFDAGKDQFNSIHEKILAHLNVLKPYLPTGVFHFACVKDSVEDYMTTAYLMDCARQTGYEVRFLYIDDIAFDDNHPAFLGIEHEVIRNIFKLYPYEWMIHEAFGKLLISTKETTRWIEPAWKMILSNKMILKVLWDLFPAHPNLLRTELMPFVGSYVRKPKLSREGANVQVVEHGKIIAETSGEYGEEGHVYQEYFKLPDMEGNTAVIGSWLIGGEAAGMGIRESTGLITSNTSRFVPHYFF